LFSLPGIAFQRVPGFFLKPSATGHFGYDDRRSGVRASLLLDGAALRSAASAKSRTARARVGGFG